MKRIYTYGHALEHDGPMGVPDEALPCPATHDVGVTLELVGYGACDAIGFCLSPVSMRRGIKLWSRSSPCVKCPAVAGGTWVKDGRIRRSVQRGTVMQRAVV